MRAVYTMETLQALRANAVIANGANLHMRMIPVKLYINKNEIEKRGLNAQIQNIYWNIDER